MNPSTCRPRQISHIGIQTYDVARLRTWYCQLLNAEVTIERIPMFSALTFDDEHHRIAISGLSGTPEARNPRAAGLFHTAITMRNVFDLLTNYVRVSELGVTPERTQHHGPTLSMYYRDPDGNEVELLVDRFKTGDEAKAFMQGPVFRHTMGAGGEIDAETLVARMRDGATEDELMFYDEEAAMKLDTEAVIARYRAEREAQVAKAGKLVSDDFST